MKTPANQKHTRQRYLLLGVLAFIFIVAYFLHWGYLRTQGMTVSVELLVQAADHMVSHPFQVFPVDKETLAGGLLVGLIALMMIYTNYTNRLDLRPGMEHGSDKWNEDIRGFRKKYADKPLQGHGSPNMIMADDIFVSMDTRKTERNCNVLCIGAAGTGKSRSQIAPNILQANCSYVISDPSGELLRSTGTYLKSQGYEIKVFNLSELAHSDCYNPFAYVSEPEDVLILVDTIVRNTESGDSRSTDPFWLKAEQSLLEAVCFYTLEVLPPEERHFGAVMELLRQASAPEGQPSVLDGLFEGLEKANPASLAVKSYGVYLSAGGGRSAQSIRLCCQVRLRAFNVPAIQKLTSRDAMELKLVGDRKTAIFCILPVSHSTYNFLSSLLFAQLFQVLYRHAETETPDGRLPIHVRFMLDEFKNIGKLPEFPTKLSTFRKYEMSCVIILQALSQIKGMYHDDWEEIVSNCDSILYLGTSDKATLEYISELLGKETIRTVNTSTSLGSHGSTTTSYNKTGRELMTPTELRTMDNRNCIYLMRGEDPFFSVKYHLERHPDYKKSGFASPDFNYNVKNEKNTDRRFFD